MECAQCTDKYAQCTKRFSMSRLCIIFKHLAHILYVQCITFRVSTYMYAQCTDESAQCSNIITHSRKLCCFAGCKMMQNRCLQNTITFIFPETTNI